MESDWKHPIDQFRPENGVYYELIYLGCYPINISIKTVEYKNRMKIARECIKRVSSKLGIVLPNIGKPADKDVIDSIGNKPEEIGKIPVTLRVTTETITLLSSQQHNEELKRHNLQDISFACGGDQELLDYLSYVAKDPELGRFCFVFQSVKEPAKDIIMSIGQAFDLRFREYQRTLLGNSIIDTKNGLTNTTQPPSDSTNQKDCDNWAFRPINKVQEDQSTNQNTLSKSQPVKLINSTVAPPSSVAPTVQAPSTTVAGGVVSHCPSNEPWYLGALSRQQAEKLLKFDGDFLVRDSNQQPNQYVLSGKQNGQFKHLLLVDPEGRVHTKEHEFTSIKHLIEFHQQNKLPIASMDSELHLLYPITNKKPAAPTDQ